MVDWNEMTDGPTQAGTEFRALSSKISLTIKEAYVTSDGIAGVSSRECQNTMKDQLLIRTTEILMRSVMKD